MAGAGKIGIVIALDGEKAFSNALKNAQKSAKLCEQGLKNLQREYDSNANSIEALTKKEEALKSKQEALTRVVNEAKSGQEHAKKNYELTAKALEKYQKELEQAERELKQMERTGDTSSKAYKDQQKAVEDLRKKVSAQSLEYQKAQGNVTSWNTQISKAEGDLKANSRALEKNTQYLEEAKGSANGVATSIDRFGREVDEAKGSTDEMNISLASMIKNKIVDLGASVLSRLGMAAADAAKEVVTTGSEFEAVMSKVEALSGASASEVDAMGTKAKKLGAATKFSAVQVGEAFSYMALAGYDATQSIEAIDGVVNLAAASDMDLAEASDLVTDYLSAFGLEAKDAGKLVDELAFAQANSNTTTSQLGEAFSGCAASAKANGQSVETTTAFLEAFANQGLKGSRAGVALNAMMADMVKHMKNGQITIGDTAIAVADSEGNFRDLTDIMIDVEAATADMSETERAEALSAIFQRKSLQGVNLALGEGMGAISGYKQELEGCDGAAASMAETMQDNLSGRVTEMNSALEGLAVALYDYLSGPLSGIVSFATGAISKITSFLSPQKTEMEEFNSQIEAMHKEVQKSLKDASDTASAGEADAAKISALAGVISDADTKYGIFIGKDPSAVVKKTADAAGEMAGEDGSLSKIGKGAEGAAQGLDALNGESLSDLSSSTKSEANKIAGPGGFLKKIKTVAGTVKEGIMGLAGADPSALGTTLGTLSGQVTGEGGSLSEIGKAAEETKEAVEGIGSADASGLDTSLTDLEGKVSGEEGSLGKIKKSADETVDAVDGLGQADASGLATSVGEVSKKLTGEGEGFLDKIKKGASDAAQGIADFAGSQINTEGITGALENVLVSQKEVSEGMDSFTSFKVKNAISELASVIPEIGAAWDETSGKLSMTKEQFDTLIDSEKLAIRQQAYVKASATATEAWAAATVEQTMAQDALNAQLGEINESAGTNFTTFKELSDAYDQASASSVTDADAMALLNSVTWDQVIAAGEANQALIKADEQVTSASENMHAYEEAASRANEQMREQEEAAGAVRDALSDQSEEQENVQKSAASMTTALGTVIEAADDSDEAMQELEETIESLDAAGIEAVAKASEEAGTRIKEAFDGAKESAKSAFSINPFEEWSVDPEKGMQAMLEAFESQIQGFENYAANLQTITRHVGQEVTPEFLQYLQDLGTEGALVAQQLASSLEGEDANPEKVVQIMEKYSEAMDIQDKVSSAMAMNEVAIKLGLGELGSTLDEWDGLSEAVNGALEGLGEDVSEEVLSEFETARQAAIDAGAKIPEGLADSIKESDNPEEAVRLATAQLNAAVKSQGEALLKSAGELGVDIPGSIATKIKAGGPGAQRAYMELLNYITSSDTSTVKDDASGTGEDLGSGVATGITDSSQTVEDAASGVTDAAVEAADQAAEAMSDAGLTAGRSYVTGIIDYQGVAQLAAKALVTNSATSAGEGASKFSEAGTSAGSNFVTGLSSQNGSAASAGSTIASRAKSAAASWTNSFYSVGYQMGAGINSGLQSTANMIANTASATVKRAVKAAQDAAQIKSPSRVMRDKVGKQLGAGLAFGIKQSTSLATDAAQTQMNRTLYAYALWMARNKKRIGSLGNQWAEDITYGWRRLANQQIRNRFGISQFTKDDNGKTVKKDATTYSGEIMQAAEAYLSNVASMYEVSEKSTLKYWETVRASVGKGTQAWYDASKKIKELRSQIGSEAVAGELYDAVTTYYDLSAKASMQYWMEVRRHYAKGTADRLKADQEYLKARGNYEKQLTDLTSQYSQERSRIIADRNEKIKDLQNDLASEIKKINEQLSKDIADEQKSLAKERKSINDQLAKDLKKIEEKLASDIQAANDRYTSAVEKRRDELISSFGIFEAFESKSEKGEQLLFNLQSQVAGLKDWSKTLEKLGKRGLLSDDLMKELSAQGPQQSAAIHALSMLSDEELKSYNRAYTEKLSFAQRQAVSENADLKQEVKAEIASLRASATTERNALKQSAAAEIQKAQKETSKTIEQLRKDAAKEINAHKKSTNNEINALKKATTTELNNLKKTYQSERKALSKDINKDILNLAKNIRSTASDEVSKVVSQLRSLSGLKSGAAGSVNANVRKAAGHASGTRRLSTNFAWMDERGNLEYLVRKSDQAMLNTLAKAGDAIIPAANVENLYDWSRISPQALATQQAALQSYLRSVSASISMAALNGRLSEGYGAPGMSSSGYDDRSVVGLMREMVSLLKEGKEIYLDTGALVGGTSMAMSHDFAMKAKRRRS